MFVIFIFRRFLYLAINPIKPLNGPSQKLSFFFQIKKKLKNWLTYSKSNDQQLKKTPCIRKFFFIMRKRLKLKLNDSGLLDQQMVKLCKKYEYHFQSHHIICGQKHELRVRCRYENAFNEC